MSPWRGLTIRKLLNVYLNENVKLQPKISNIDGWLYMLAN